MIEDRNLGVGTRLVGNYKKQTYVCTVEVADEGEGVLYVLEDGSKHKSPSAAGMKVMGGKAVNGWRFWSLEGEAKPAAGSEKPARQAKSRSRKQITKAPSQANVPQGKVRWFSSACLKAFIGDAERPTTCPEGHSAEAEGETDARPEAKKQRGRKTGYHLIRPAQHQEDVPEGQARWWCDACGDLFLGSAGETPEQCPNGHRVDDPQFSGENAPAETAEVEA